MKNLPGFCNLRGSFPPRAAGFTRCSMLLCIVCSRLTVQLVKAVGVAVSERCAVKGCCFLHRGMYVIVYLILSVS